MRHRIKPHDSCWICQKSSDQANPPLRSLDGGAPMMSKEARARAAEMWRRSQSAGVIAEGVGPARSAVVAKLRRFGVRRAVQSPGASLRPQPAKPRKPKLKLVCEPLWITSLLDLKPGMCRFARDGDGRVEFCGAATQSLSSSWCPAHKLICCATDPRRRA
jgi:hypothetical protein